MTDNATTSRTDQPAPMRRASIWLQEFVNKPPIEETDDFLNYLLDLFGKCPVSFQLPTNGPAYCLTRFGLKADTYEVQIVDAGLLSW
jgi:hypothetical protein